MDTFFLMLKEQTLSTLGNFSSKAAFLTAEVLI